MDVLPLIWDFSKKQVNTFNYYMASSVSGQDEPNRALWLATRAGKMEPSCPLGTTRCIPQAKFHQKPYNKSFIDQVCSVKMAGYWPRSFLASLWTSTSSRSINTQKKELGQYPAILTSHLVNNPYFWNVLSGENHRAQQCLNQTVLGSLLSCQASFPSQGFKKLSSWNGVHDLARCL